MTFVGELLLVFLTSAVASLVPASRAVRVQPVRLLLDKLARESGRSRNRVIVEACEAYFAEAREQWPEDFFRRDRLARSDEKTLSDSLEAWLQTIQSSRRNRTVEPF